MNSKLFDNLKTWMTTKQAAEYLCISTQALRNRVCRGEIHSYTFGKRSLRFKKSELDELIEASKNNWSNQWH